MECIGYGYEESPSLTRQRQTVYLVSEFCGGGTLKALVLRQMKDLRKELYSDMDALRCGRGL